MVILGIRHTALYELYILKGHNTNEFEEVDHQN